jgi:outer membrane protein assembly factor BamB
LGIPALALALTTAAFGADDGVTGPAGEARRILDAAGVSGGVVVHFGCGDGRLTAALRAGESYVVQGLDSDLNNVEAARRHVRSLGLYGPVSIRPWSAARLPYVENMVNLVVCEDLGELPMDEVIRVLAPGGVAYVKSGGRWSKTVKPRPANIDRWTHYLHDPTNNAVAHDDVIAPPTRLQWIEGPRYSRQHDHMSSISAMVSSGERNFFIFDEAPRQSILTPSEWKLVARDAFNGALLWQRPVGPWHTQLWPLKSGPQMLTRRLVAEGDRVYATLAIDAPVTAIDAASGQTVRTYEDTQATEEILLADGVLYLVVADRDKLHSDPKRTFASVQEVIALHNEQSWGPEARTVMAVDARSGAVRWRVGTSVTPMTLAVDDGRVYFHDGQKVVCLDRRDGAPRWASEPILLPDFMPSQGAAVLVVYDGVVLFAGGAENESGRIRRGNGLCALSAADGTRLWSATQPFVWGGALRDVLVTGGLAWCGDVAGGADSGVMTGRDPRTGEIKKEFPPDVDIFWFHHRCYRAKATDNYLLYSRTGIEFIDPETSHWTTNHWVRGGCLYGIMPANGMIYNPPHPCACYSEAKLYGFNAIAPPSTTWAPPREVSDEGRLETGPAYGGPATARSSLNPDPPSLDPSSDWPTYRHDASRSGATASSVPAEALQCVWQADLGGRLSSLTAAGGKVFVSSIDAHTVYALDEATGKPAWSFTAGGRVDSPPTIWQGRALFGSTDGCVYCLDAADGRLAWRFRAAPEDRQLGAMDQLESVWPVHGSVLVEHGTLYCVAGRSMFLDGGLRMLRLDPATGRKLSETIFDERDPASGENLQSHVTGLNMPVAMPDVLSSDGRYVYMRSLPFDLEGNRKFVDYVEVDQQQGDDVHLFSPTGFLDDTMWHRTYWVYGRAWASGAGGYFKAGQVAPAGRLLVVDGDNVYGYGRLWQYYRWTTPMEFHLFAMSKQPEVTGSRRDGPAPDRAAGETRKEAKKKGDRPLPASRVVELWSDRTPVQVSAMVLAGKTLFVAGPPDLVDEEEAAREFDDAEIQKQLAEQQAAFEGRRGAILQAVSTDGGEQLAAYRLDSMPNFDGMATAGGRLYLSATDGTILCLGAGDGKPLEPASDVSVIPGSTQAE